MCPKNVHTLPITTQKTRHCLSTPQAALPSIIHNYLTSLQQCKTWLCGHDEAAAANYLLIKSSSNFYCVFRFCHSKLYCPPFCKLSLLISASPVQCLIEEATTTTVRSLNILSVGGVTWWKVAPRFEWDNIMKRRATTRNGHRHQQNASFGLPTSDSFLTLLRRPSHQRTSD